MSRFFDPITNSIFSVADEKDTRHVHMKKVPSGWEPKEKLPTKDEWAALEAQASQQGDVRAQLAAERTQ